MRIIGALLVLSIPLLVSCARITFREAMQDVQKKYITLTQTLETGLEEPKNFEARRRADDLREALENPTIRTGHRFAREERFQKLLAEAIDAVEKVNIEAKRFDPYELWSVRDNISYRCQDCHDVYRE